MRAQQLKSSAKKTSESVSAMTSKAITSAEVLVASSIVSVAEPVQEVKTKVSEVDKNPQDMADHSVWAEDEPEVMVGDEPPKTWDEFETQSTGSPSKIRPLKASEEGNSELEPILDFTRQGQKWP